MGLATGDVVQIFDLLGECLEVWDDPEAWQDHLTTGIERLIGGCAGVFAVTRPGREGTAGTLDAGIAPPDVGLGGSTGFTRTIDLLEAKIAPTDVGLRARFGQYMREGAFSQLPEISLIAVPLMRDHRLTYVQSELVSRRAYYRSEFYQRYMRGYGIANLLSSVELRPDGMTVGLSIMRQRGERTFSARNEAVLALVTRVLAGLIGERLATAREHLTRSSLPPRLRKSLVFLLEGASEKELAQSLCVSPATAHEYVMDLYRYYGVDSRSRLMALFVRRRPIPRSRSAAPARK